jgi:hypothetical protein
VRRHRREITGRKEGNKDHSDRHKKLRVLIDKSQTRKCPGNVKKVMNSYSEEYGNTRETPPPGEGREEPSTT